MVHTWHAKIHLFSAGDDSTAHAVLTTGSGTTLDGYGRARRNPGDTDVPEIGEELAAARALRDLADRLLRATSDDIAQVEHEKVHLAR